WHSMPLNPAYRRPFWRSVRWRLRIGGQDLDKSSDSGSGIRRIGDGSHHDDADRTGLDHRRERAEADATNSEPGTGFQRRARPLGREAHELGPRGRAATLGGALV